MDANRFDGLSRQIFDATSRRRFMRVLGAGSFAALGAWPLGAVDADAKRKHKKKHKRKKAKPEPKPKLNAFGCVNVGDACTSEEQCCSGICERGTGGKTCQAHDSGDCLAGMQIDECGGTNVACTTSSGAPGACGTTTGNAGYCVSTGMCHACQTDTDCQTAQGGAFGPNAACIPCATCTGVDEGTACVNSAPFAGISPDRRIS